MENIMKDRLNMPNNCPILEQTADGINVGRCFYYLKNNICPRHGNVEMAVDFYKKNGTLILENDFKELVKFKQFLRDWKKSNEENSSSN